MTNKPFDDIPDTDECQGCGADNAFVHVAIQGKDGLFSTNQVCPPCAASLTFELDAAVHEAPNPGEVPQVLRCPLDGSHMDRHAPPEGSDAVGTATCAICTSIWLLEVHDDQPFTSIVLRQVGYAPDAIDVVRAQEQLRQRRRDL